MIPNAPKSYLVLNDVARMVFLKPQKGQGRIWQSKKFTAVPLFLFSYFTFCFSGRRGAKPILHPTGSGTEDCHVYGVSVIPEKTHCYCYFIKIIWVRGQNQND